jgi:hypothetical protein
VPIQNPRERIVIAVVNDQIRCPEEREESIEDIRVALTRDCVPVVVSAAHRWCPARNPEPAA